MSLDVYLTVDEEEVCSMNITHNLSEMAEEAGIYEALWRPYRCIPEYKPDNLIGYEDETEFEDSHPVKAYTIIPLLEQGLYKLKDSPEYYKQFDSDNGWGIYEHFVPFVEEYLQACKTHPEAIVKVWR